MSDSGEPAWRITRERVRITTDELVVYVSQHSIVCVSDTTWVLAAAHSVGGIIPGGTLTFVGITRYRRMIDLGEARWTMPEPNVAVRTDTCAVRSRVAAPFRQPFEILVGDMNL